VKCGKCTLCCTLLPVPVLNKPAGMTCKHCHGGCDIYETRGDECRGFQCAYNQAEKARIELRPDHCGVIFEKLSDRLFYGTARDDELSEVAMSQIRYFMHTGFSVIIKKTLYLAPGHNVKDIEDDFNDRVKRLAA